MKTLTVFYFLFPYYKLHVERRTIRQTYNRLGDEDSGWLLVSATWKKVTNALVSINRIPYEEKDFD